MRNMLLFGFDIYSDFEGFDVEEIVFIDPNFTPSKNRSHDKNRINLQKRAVNKNVPEGFSMKNWKKGDSEVMPQFPFIWTPGFKVQIPDENNIFYFLKLFLDEEIIASLTLQTVIQGNVQKLEEHFRFFK